MTMQEFRKKCFFFVFANRTFSCVPGHAKMQLSNQILQYVQKMERLVYIATIHNNTSIP